MITPITRRSLLLAGLLLACGCQRPFSPPPPAQPAEHLARPAQETPQLTERQYLMRKATLGTRSERLEALDVIERSNDAEQIPFLLERLEKEDDPFLRVRIMQALAQGQDIRAVEPIRKVAQKDMGRVGIEAVGALYELGDDNYVPKLIRTLRLRDDFPELAGIAHRNLKQIYEVELPPSPRIWNNYFRSHRLAPYQKLRWYSSFRPPLPPTVAGTTKVIPRPKGPAQLPEEDVRVRRHIVSGYEFWKPDEP